jgi:hypothetical protein
MVTPNCLPAGSVGDMYWLKHVKSSVEVSCYLPADDCVGFGNLRAGDFRF